jgi:hypothetical protein
MGVIYGSTSLFLEREAEVDSVLPRPVKEVY